MSDLLNAIVANDIVKFKQCFYEAMTDKVGSILKEERLKIAKSIMIEGEEPEEDEEDESDDESGDSSDDDEADEKDDEKDDESGEDKDGITLIKSKDKDKE